MAEHKSSKCLEWDQVFDPNGLPPHSPNGIAAGDPKQIDPSVDFQSATITTVINGCECRWTLRCADVRTLASRIEFITARYRFTPPPTDPGKPVPFGSGDEDDVKFCQEHGVPFRKHERFANGKTRRWWSHQTPDGWCNFRKDHSK